MTAIADPDLALTGGIVVTLDDERRVIDDGTVSYFSAEENPGVCDMSSGETLLENL